MTHSEQLYNSLLNKGYTEKNIGDRDTFLTKMQDKENRRKLYDFISKRGDFRIGNYENYEKRIASDFSIPQPLRENIALAMANPMDKVNPALRTQSAKPIGDVQASQNIGNKAALTFKDVEPMPETSEVLQRNAETLAGINDPAGLTKSPDNIQQAVSQDLVGKAASQEWQRDTLNSVSGMREEAKKKIKERAEELRNSGEDFDYSQWQQSPSQYGYAPMTTPGVKAPNLHSDREMNLYRLTIETLDEAQKHMETVRENQSRNGFQQAAAGVGDAIFDIDTLTLGLDSLAKNATLKAILDKADADQPLTQAEESLLNAALYKQFTEAALPNGRWYNIGKGIGENIPYMLQFGLSGLAAGALTKGATKAIGKAVTKYINNLALKNGGKIANKATRALGNGISKLSAGTLKALAQTPLQTSLYNDIIERQIGTLGYNPGEDGALDYTGRIDADNTADAITKGLTSGFITNLTESIGGEGIQFITNKIGGLMGKGANAVFKNLQSPRWYNRLRESFRRNGFGEFVKATSWQGPVAEYGEEILDQTLNAIFVGDSSLDPNSENYVFDLDNLIDTAITTGAISLFMGALGGAASAKVHHDVNKAFAQANHNLEELKYSNLEIQALNDIAIDNPQNTAKWVSSITRTMRTLATSRDEIVSSLSPEARQYLDKENPTDEDKKALSLYDLQALAARGEITNRFNELTIQRDYVVAATNYNAMIQGLKERVAPQAEAELADIQANALRDSDYTVKVTFRGQDGYLVSGTAEINDLPDGSTEATLPAGNIYQVRTKSPDGQWLTQQAVAEDIQPISVTPTQQLIDETTARIYTPVQNLINAEQAQAQAEVAQSQPPVPAPNGTVEQTEQAQPSVETTPAGLNTPTAPNGTVEQTSPILEQASPILEQASPILGTPTSSVIGRSLSADESQNLIAQMEQNAEVAPEVELTPENWINLFGEDGTVDTPIGSVKMGENQYFKLAQQGRNGKLGMVKPTLQAPSFIIEDTRPEANSERDSSYIFVKTFTKQDGSRFYYFTSVTVSKDGKEVVISNQEKSANKISKLLQNGKIAWIDTAFSLHPTTQIEESVPLNDSNKPTSTDNQSALLGINSPELSTDKVTTSSLNNNNSDENVLSDEQFDEYIATLPTSDAINAITQRRGAEEADQYAQWRKGILTKERDKAQKALNAKVKPFDASRYPDYAQMKREERKHNEALQATRSEALGIINRTTAEIADIDRYLAERNRQIAAEREAENPLRNGIAQAVEKQPINTIEQYIARYIALGGRLRMTDQYTNGLAAELGITPGSQEHRELLSILSNTEGMTPEQLAQDMVENIEPEYRHLIAGRDTQDIRNAIIDTIQSGVTSRRRAYNFIADINQRAADEEQRYIDEQELQAEIDADTEQAIRDYEELLLSSLTPDDLAIIDTMTGDYWDELLAIQQYEQEAYNDYDTNATTTAPRTLKQGAESTAIQSSTQPTQRTTITPNGTNATTIRPATPQPNDNGSNSIQLPQENKINILDPRDMSDAEKQRRGDMLRNAHAVEVQKDAITSTPEISARKAAELWWDENVGEPALYNTEAGEVEINKNSIESSLAHRYGQKKLDAITSLIEGFENAVYLGTMEDGTRQEGVFNHYFAYPIMYDGELNYVFCRAMQDANKNRLYVHEVFLGDKITKGNTLQTAASQPHGGISLYRDILANVLSIGKANQSSSQSQEINEEINKQVAQAESTGSYTITPTQYTTKRGNVLDMQLVKFTNDLTKEQYRTAKELAKADKGWYDREQGGFMMRSQESAQQLADTIASQPISMTDIKALNDGDIAFTEPQQSENKPHAPIWQYSIHVDTDGYTVLTREDVSSGIAIGDALFSSVADSPEEMLEILRNPHNNMQEVLDAVEVILENKIKTRELDRKIAEQRKQDYEALRANGVNGYKIGEKVIYKGKEATIYDFEEFGAHRPVLDTGLAPIIYDAAEWSDIEHLDK
ncbi:MAG: hypothetical protein J6V00_08090, partial [Bacteroidaceae bacterium]|nr:hypothetical protein [Bacteroidaceae bacterium]